ncbi:MAG: hypothetical protein IKL20_00070 [Alistipes sp.]|nr:hypothetical protein [Alistipes sp.]
MVKVEEVIQEYLLSNRRLVVPGFGAFMAKESGERVFSDLLRTDDGVLTSLLREQGMSEMECAVTIDRFIFEVRHELEEYGYCRLGALGTLRIDPEMKVLRLYPPIKSEMQPTTQSPYIPEPIAESEGKELEAYVAKSGGESDIRRRILSLYDDPQPAVAVEVEVKPKESVVEEPVAESEKPAIEPVEEPEKPAEEPADEPVPAPQPAPRKRRRKARKGADWVMILAITVAVLALLGIAYGWYVSTLDYVDTATDDEAMSLLRIQPVEQ